MADKRKDRMTTKEEEEKLKRRKNESGLRDDEVKEDVPTDNQPLQQEKDEAERGRDVKKQKDKKRQLRNEPDD